MLVLLGGGIGAAIRGGFVLAATHLHGPFPSAILVASLLAAFLIVLVVPLTRGGRHLSSGVRLFVATGIMGGLSTFSILMWGTLSLRDKPGGTWIGLSYLGASLALGLILFDFGLRLGGVLSRPGAVRATPQPDRSPP